ncbi:DUF4236 domain-containing protein [Azonexus sp. IMCC34839]|uniref:DUF4236 domain-containing protein n=1 Tax=Azonexus sp. IMCC34839 TaxID=3133695 RepID=UPI00399B51A2
MGWRFRKSFSPFPGVRLTLTPSGISTSIGVGPVRLSAGRRGPALTVNVPGTGLSFRHSLADVSPQPQRSPKPAPFAPPPTFTPVVETPIAHLDDIKSSGSGALTTPGLGEFKQLLERANSEHAAINVDLTAARSEEKRVGDKYARWRDGWLFRRLFKSKFKQLAHASEEATAMRLELEEQKRLSRLATQIDMPSTVAQEFHRMVDEFALMAKSVCIWDTVGQRGTNRIVERTSASRIVDRKSVAFGVGKCEVIESEWSVPHLANANGGDIFLYPGFVLYFVSNDAFALLEYKEVELNYSPSRFIEEGSIPKDSTVVDHTWAKVNKDGSPDRRFKDNYQIPVALYGRLVFNSATGLNEEYLVSNAGQAEVFAKAWNRLVAAACDR